MTSKKSNATLSLVYAPSDLRQLVLTLNRWLTMLDCDGQLIPADLTPDFNLINDILRNSAHGKQIIRAIQSCRDLVLYPETPDWKIRKAIYRVINSISDAHTDRSLKNVRRRHRDCGMTERYRALTRRIHKECINKIGSHPQFVNTRSNRPSDIKLLHRFIEKRAAQEVHRKKKSYHGSGSLRQQVRRAVSFSFYQLNFADYEMRTSRTHWKVVRYKNNPKLKAKKAFATYDEALAACQNYANRHPDDDRPVTPYLCAECNRWHIGHLSDAEAETA